MSKVELRRYGKTVVAFFISAAALVRLEFVLPIFFTEVATSGMRTMLLEALSASETHAAIATVDATGHALDQLTLSLLWVAVPFAAFACGYFSTRLVRVSGMLRLRRRTARTFTLVAVALLACYAIALVAGFMGSSTGEAFATYMVSGFVGPVLIPLPWYFVAAGSCLCIGRARTHASTPTVPAVETE
jgi:hypothetical protein